MNTLDDYLHDLKMINSDEFEDMPSRRLHALRPLLGRELKSVQLNDKIIPGDDGRDVEYATRTRREALLEYLGDTLFAIGGGGGVRVSVADALQSLNLHPPTPLLPQNGVDAYGDSHDLIDVSEFPDWRPLLGRRIDGIDIVIGDYAPEKFGEGVLERGLQFRLEGGLSFIIAVWDEAGALWLPGEMPDRWRREIHSITPIV